MIRYDRPHTPSISAYVDGCRAECCRPFAAERSRSYRDRVREAAGAPWDCVICGKRYMTENGRNGHETVTHSRRVAS